MSRTIFTKGNIIFATKSAAYISLGLPILRNLTLTIWLSSVDSHSHSTAKFQSIHWSMIWEQQSTEVIDDIASKPAAVGSNLFPPNKIWNVRWSVA